MRGKDSALAQWDGSVRPPITPRQKRKLVSGVGTPILDMVLLYVSSTLQILTEMAKTVNECSATVSAIYLLYLELHF